MKEKNIFFIVTVLVLAFASDAMTDTSVARPEKKMNMAAIAANIKPDDDRSWVMKDVYEKATQFASTISCAPEFDLKKIVPLVPWDDDHDIWDARYALIWRGDIRCTGGSGSSQPHITIVGLGSGGSVAVLPKLSSPVIEFDPSVRIINKIIDVTANELTLEGMDWSSSDALCCPSMPVHIFMRRDKKNNWKLIKKTPVINNP